MRQFASILLPSLYLHLTWKSIIKSCTNWIIRLTSTAYFSSIAISPLTLGAVELKRNHAFILYEHVGFLSNQCIINLLQRVKPNYQNRFISIWTLHFSSLAEVLISRCSIRMTFSRGYSVSSSEWLLSDTDKEITFSSCHLRCCNNGYVLCHFANRKQCLYT